MATASATYHKPKSDFHGILPPVRFDHDFIERRMRQHREYQQQLASEGAAEIVHEVVGALETFAELRAGKGPGKIARLR